MTRYDRVGTNDGQPSCLVYLPFLEIHYLCNCTWVPDLNKGMYRLKYKNTACLVTYWHKEIEKGISTLNGAA